MRNIFFIFAALTLFVLSGCLIFSGRAISAETNAAQAVKYQKITSDEAKQMMDDGEAFILLDVRTEEEFEANRIEGAVLIPNNEIIERAPTELPDKDARILIYCRSGRRSAQAAHDLINLGYTEIFDFGGIIDWPYETLDGNF